MSGIAHCGPVWHCWFDEGARVGLIFFRTEAEKKRFRRRSLSLTTRKRPSSLMASPLLMDQATDGTRVSLRRELEAVMSRLYELKSHSYEGDVATIIDLDKVCWLQIEKKPGQHYPHLVVRFVDGHEWHDLMIDQSAYQLIEAYRAHLSGRAPNKIENGYGMPSSGFPKSRGARLATTDSGSVN